MKHTFIKITFMLLFALATNQIKAQSKTITDTFTVSGNCKQCKTRIEDATYIKGVKSAEWNKKTHLLTVIFNTEKTSLEKIATAVANAGHDNRLAKATDNTYNKLPGCCAYRTGVCHHE
jgi:hypothetical protein